MTITRTLCPLDCGWHHDHNPTEPINPTAIHFYDTQPPTEALDPTAWTVSQMRTQFVEGLLREHCATHELTEWVQAIATARQQLVDEKARQAAYEESVVGALNERNTSDCRRADTAEAQVAAVRAYADSLYSADRKIDACGVREKLYELLPVAPAEGAPDGFRWHVLSACPDEAACPIHGRNEGEPAGPEDGVDLPELTPEDAVEAMQDMATELYKAEDRLAFVREMCDAAEQDGSEITPERLRSWLAYTGCGGVLRLPDEVMPLLQEFAASEGVATSATQASTPDPNAEERQQDALAHIHDTETDHWGGRWAWRCDGHQHCTGDISLGHLTQEAAASSYLRHVDECHGTEPTERQLHARRACPGWEYDTTEGPRKTWDDVDRPPEGDGWERNVDAGRDGWERFDYTEESYWRRRTAAGEQR